MEILPNQFFQGKILPLNIYDYKVFSGVTCGKIMMQQNVISFLVEGKKEVNFSHSSIQIADNQILVIAQGNCIMTEKIYCTEKYRSILLFFSKEKLTDFILKNNISTNTAKQGSEAKPYFSIVKDEYIKAFIQSLSLQFYLESSTSQRILEAKFEEIMLYLIGKYKDDFVSFLLDLVSNDFEISFRKTIEDNRLNNLNIEQIAFLCNMSISTFKRHFEEIFNQTPGKWFRQQRLTKAKEMLTLGEHKSSDIYQSFGYENLSNFSAAYKQVFGVSPRNN